MPCSPGLEEFLKQEEALDPPVRATLRTPPPTLPKTPPIVLQLNRYHAAIAQIKRKKVGLLHGCGGFLWPPARSPSTYRKCGGGGGGLIDVSEAPLLRISQGLCSAVGFQSAEQRGRAHGASVINTSPAGLARR